MTGRGGDQKGYLEDFEKLTGRTSSSGCGWTTDLRTQAMERFQSLGFPSTRDEEWKYTNVDSLRNARLRVVDPVVQSTAQTGDAFWSDDWGRYELNFPRIGDAPGSIDTSDGDVFIGHLADAMASRQPWVESHLGRYADYQDHPFRALNTAFMEDGGAVWLGPGRTLDGAVGLVFLAPSGHGANYIQHPRTLVVVGAGSSLTLVEAYAGSAENAYCNNAVTEVVLEEDAVLDHYRLLRGGIQAFHIGTVQVRQSRNSRYRSHSLTSGGAIARVEINSLLDGEGAECILQGVYVAGGQQHIENRTLIDHAKPRCTSRELYKGVLSDGARGVFNGKIVVREDAQETNARQSNRNLILSPNAEIDSKPQLEILANNVQCSHGTTIGQINEDELFYLQSRGLDHASARGLLVQGFLNEVLDGISIAPLRDGLKAQGFTDLYGSMS